MNAEAFAYRHCPVCASETLADVQIASNPPAERFSFANLRQSWFGFFKEKHFFTYARCSRCKTLYCPTFFSDDQLKTLYSSMPDNTAGVPETALQRTQAGYLKVLNGRSTLSGAYMEIGPDIGLFTRLASKLGTFTKYWLYEPNIAVHERLKSAVGNAACEIHTDMFDYAAVPDHSVGCLVMIHVLDHLTDPKSVLRSLHKKLTDDATVIIVTHDESSFLARVLGPKWPAYCLQHPQLYSPQSMAALLEASGYQCRTVTKTVNYFPITYLLKHLLWVLGLKLELPLFPRLSIGLKLGNIITVATPSKTS